MKLNITCIPGDGIGPEIVTEAKKVLDKVASEFGHSIEYKDILMGGCSIDVHGVPLTDEAIADAKSADAVLMGSIGGNTSTSPWYKLEPSLRPEAGLLKLRKALNLFANLRPAYLYPQLKDACPLKEAVADKGFDMIGLDASSEMLNQAIKKRDESKKDILYLLQDMTEFELYGTVSAIVSVCDSMNYITDPEDLTEVFRLCNNYLEAQGILIFDLNTVYKYEKELGQNIFAENREDSAFIWENEYDPETRINEYDLTLFIRDAAEEPDEDEEEGLFRRFMETHYQRAYSLEEIRSCLEEAGMEYITAYDAFTKEAPRPDSERIYVVAREKRQEGKLYL